MWETLLTFLVVVYKIGFFCTIAYLFWLKTGEDVHYIRKQKWVTKRTTALLMVIIGYCFISYLWPITTPLYFYSNHRKKRLK